MSESLSRGKSISDTIHKCLREFKQISVAGGSTREHRSDARNRARTVIMNVHPQGTFVNGNTVDGFFEEAIAALVASGQIYCREDSIHYEIREAGSQQLITLATRRKAEPGVDGLLTNLVCVAVPGKDEGSVSESIMSPRLVNALLTNSDLWNALPKIRYYGRRPMFDEDFNLCGPGWHADKGILIHGKNVEPIMPPTCPASTGNGLDHFRALLMLLKEFCFRDAIADSTNAVAMLLTGLLVNHFVDDPHPGFVMDGNQPELGKSLLVRCVSHILDECEPKPIALGSDEELQKKLSAHLLESQSGIIFLDNVRGRIESAVLEQNILSPVLSFRVLGLSQNTTRPNTYLWATTSNLTSGTSDFLRRNIPIRFYFEGNPRLRNFAEELVHYAQRHRLEILGELMGMVIHWKQAGKPLSEHKHRCSQWAKVIGGILQVNGLQKFLSNLDEAEAAMDDGLQGLAALAEAVVGKNKTDFFVRSGDDASSKGQPAKSWTQVFVDAEVCEDELAKRGGKGRDTMVGQFLSAKIDRTVDITMPIEGTATLRAKSGRSKLKLYWLEIAANNSKDAINPSPADFSTPTILSGMDVNPVAPWASSQFSPVVNSGSSLCQDAVVGPMIPPEKPTAGTASNGDSGVHRELTEGLGVVGNGLQWA